MSFSQAGRVSMGSVGVAITRGRGLSATELADMAMDKVMYVSRDAPPAIRDQAELFRAQVHQVLLTHLAQAQKSERTTIIAALERAGMSDAANLVRGI